MNDKKRQYWKKRIKDYKTSGLTAAKWCEQNGVNIHTLKSYITKINKINKEKKQRKFSKTKWASVVPDQAKTSAVNNKPIKVKIDNVTVEITKGFDLNTFEAVLRILKKQC